MSEQKEHKNIANKLIQVMEKCGYIQKDSQNKEQKYKYVSAAAVSEKINTALVETRLVSIPRFSIVSEKEKTTKNGAVWQLVTVQCVLHIVDADSGESVSVTSLGCGTDMGDKAVAKAQTMALKYAWLTALNIETGDEPEADERTDQQEFYSNQPGQAPAPIVPKELAGNTRIQAICQFWHALGWNTNGLANYLEQRFSKPINQINDTELAAIANEAQIYYEQKGLRV